MLLSICVQIYVWMYVFISPLFISRTFHHPKLKICTYFKITPHYPLCSAPGNHYFTFRLYEFDILATSYKCTHTVFVLLHLAYLTWLNVLKVHSCCSLGSEFSSFLKLNNIPLNTYTTFSKNMYHILKCQTSSQMEV